MTAAKQVQTTEEWRRMLLLQPGVQGDETLVAPMSAESLVGVLPIHLLVIGTSLNVATKGGEGSGNFGHAGRPGEEGGSAADDSIGSYGDTRLPVVAPRNYTAPERVLSLARFNSFVATRNSYGGDSIQRREAALSVVARNNKPLSQVERAMRVWTNAPLSSSLAITVYESAAARAFSLDLDRKTGEQYYKWLGVRANAIAKGDISLARAISHPYEYPPADVDLKAYLADLPKELRSADQIALVAQLQAQYEHTQELLKTSGIEGVDVYLAANLSKQHERNDTIAFNAHRILSTWTSDLRYALTGAESENRYVLRTYVPRERILALPQTGLGAMRRSDVIMIAGHKSVGTAKVFAVPPRPRS